ncbi:unnamed protein product [Microthlaspi erraticum]|uniref:Uncharacterized protein n=1 Tax=Microthlaspi erraticum TaxID=1685480 RepID=A0A6D2K0E5_9BRAS|nr:unnamed protein product [Microthlaspi erraticum]
MQPWPPLSLGVDHSSPLKEGSLPKSLTEPLHSNQGKEKAARRGGGRALRSDAPARQQDSIESKQRKLNSIELRVELTWRSPCLRTPDLSTIQRLTRTSPRPTRPPTTVSSRRSSSKAKEATPTLKMKKKKRRSRKLDRVRRLQSSGVLLMAVYHLLTTT